MKELYYFGTDLNTHGHYFFDATGDRLQITDISFKQLPFSPEYCFPLDTVYGKNKAEEGVFVKMEYKMFAIIAISGSCTDKRQGSKTVFFAYGKLGELEKQIQASPIAQTILAKLPFKVGYKEILNPQHYNP